MKSVSRIFVIMISLFLLASSTYGFDEERKGFVFGGGMGYAPATGWQIGSGADIVRTAFVANLLIGYGWNDNNILVINSYRAFSKSFSYETDACKTKVTAFGTRSLDWYHYFGIGHGAVYSILGIGWIDAWSCGYTQEGKVGLSAGVGYEYGRHIHLGLYASSTFSKAAYDLDREARYYQFSLMVNLLAY